MNEIFHPSPWRRWQRRVSSALVRSLPFGAGLMPARVPITTARHRFPLGMSKTLLIFLPGINDLPGEFSRRGLADATWRVGLSADVVEADAHLGYYVRTALVNRLHQDLVSPARSQGYERVWLAGVSSGGFGAMLYAREHPEMVDGLVLLAPLMGPAFGSRRSAGSRQRHQPDRPQQDIRSWLMSSAAKPPVYLGFGDRDRFAPSLRLLAELMPKGRVFVGHGGHDWIAWSRLWEIILSRLLTQPRHWA